MQQGGLEAEVFLQDSTIYTQDYVDEAFALYGLEELRQKAPPIALSTDVVGAVTHLAHLGTGLAEGTPVVAGLHDVDSGAIGAGAVRAGQLAVMAGTWSINEVISAKPSMDPQWFCRAFIERGTWMNMSISPASSFLPFLYGNPLGIDASAALVGLRAWHRRGHVLRAIFEGIAFNHRFHVDPLASAFEVDDIRVVGGVTQSAIWPQMFADAMGRPLTIPVRPEGGSLGAAMVAAVGIGAFADLSAAAEAMGSEVRTVEPDPDGVQRMQERYDAFLAQVDVQRPWWEAHHASEG